MDLSRRRQHIRSLHERLGDRMDLCLARSTLLAASPYTHRTKCGKPGCKCADSDYRHEMECVSYMEGDKSRTRVIPRGKKNEILKMIDAYKGVKRARREMRELFEELMSEIEEMTAHRCREGKERFDRFTEKSKKTKPRARKEG